MQNATIEPVYKKALYGAQDQKMETAVEYKIYMKDIVKSCEVKLSANGYTDNNSTIYMNDYKVHKELSDNGYYKCGLFNQSYKFTNLFYEIPTSEYMCKSYGISNIRIENLKNGVILFTYGAHIFDCIHKNKPYVWASNDGRTLPILYYLMAFSVDLRGDTDVILKYDVVTVDTTCEMPSCYTMYYKTGYYAELDSLDRLQNKWDISNEDEYTIRYSICRLCEHLVENIKIYADNIDDIESVKLRIHPNYPIIDFEKHNDYYECKFNMDELFNISRCQWPCIVIKYKTPVDLTLETTKLKLNVCSHNFIEIDKLRSRDFHILYEYCS